LVGVGVTLSSCSNLAVYQSVWCKLTYLFIRGYVLPTTRVTAILKGIGKQEIANTQNLQQFFIIENKIVPSITRPIQ